MMRRSDILKQKLNEISLSAEEEKDLWQKAREIVGKISKVSKGTKVVVGGSLAKKTLVKKQIQDIDIFVVFSSEKEIKEIGGILKKAKLKTKRVHGSRDYFQVKSGREVLEIIPVLKISNLKNVRNVTDFSLGHVDYIKSKIKKNKKLSGEIKLAKAFCFANGCYGAESYIGGFSGYGLEILVIYFGSFVRFLKGVQKKRVIDPEKYFKNEKQILFGLNESKLHSPLILIDPCYKYRNVCAGLKQETFDRFLKVSGQFLKSPTIKMFERKEVDVAGLEKFAKKKKARFVELDLGTDRQKGDIAGAKMKKFFDFVVKELGRKQQNVLFKEFLYEGKGNTATAYLVVKEKKEINIKGPALCMGQAIGNFKKAKKKTFSKAGFLYSKEKIDLKKIFVFLKRYEKDMNVSFEIKQVI